MVAPCAPQDIHVQYDLNDLYHRERWPQIGPYDVIVMGEVIEHLYTGASTVLAGLATIVKPNGSLFLQTPNAAALHKRIQLAAGRNPYMSLEEERTDPPHFHEFTVRRAGRGRSARRLARRRRRDSQRVLPQHPAVRRLQPGLLGAPSVVSSGNLDDADHARRGRAGPVTRRSASLRRRGGPGVMGVKIRALWA